MRERSGGDGGGSDDLNLDPLLVALLKKVPDAEKGWPAAQRVRWFRAFAMNVSQIYDGDDKEPKMKTSRFSSVLVILPATGAM